MQEKRESVCLGHEPCPACGSRNNLGRYDDGHGWCFGCGYYERGDMDEGSYSDAGHGNERQTRADCGDLRLFGDIESLPKRGLTQDTCKLWNYRVGVHKDKLAQLAWYLDANRKPVACKVRYPNKDFVFIGNAKEAGLYGQWLWRDRGDRVVVTEGEIDALTVSQLQSNKWPVVSVPNGAQGAAKAIRKNLEWLNRFKEVVFLFDMDEPGQQAAVECAKLLKPGQAKIARLNGFKDASEALQAGQGKHVIDAIWGAKEYRPDGIVSASDLWEQVSSNEPVYSETYPYEGLTKKTGGIRKRELVTITAGSGIGKSLFCREIAYDLLVNKGWRVGYIALEENNARTILGLMGIHLNRPLHISKDGVDPDALRGAFDAVSGGLSLYDSFGSIDPDNLLDRLRYMAVGLQCDALFLDHISIAISGLEDIDERRALDVMMTKLRSLVEETGVTLFVVSHLKRPSMGDKGHEQGLQTSLAQLRGSHAIAQLSDMVVGLERNQQGDNPNETIVRVLKNRFSGDTGPACSLHFCKETGRLTEQAFKPEEETPF